MRLRYAFGAVVLTLILLALAESEGHAQPPGFGGGGGGGRGLNDPKSMFAYYAGKQNSKDELDISRFESSRFPDLPGKMKAYAASVNITNGKLTVDQFSDFWSKKDSFGSKDAQPMGSTGPGGFGGRGFGGQQQGPPRDSAGGKDGQPMGGFGGRGFGGQQGPPRDTPMATPMSGGEQSAGNADPNRDRGQERGRGGDQGNRSTGPDPKQIEREGDERAKEWFFRRDRDRDGVLSDNEVSDDFRPEMAKWDTNRNGVIEFSEFVLYARDRVARDYAEKQRFEDFKRAVDTKTFPGTSVNPNAVVPNTTVFEDRKPVVIRSDNLPKTLPTWFKELDTDKDAQVGLYEWRTAGKEMDEFRKYDRNGDGLVTVDEVLWYAQYTKTATTLASLTPAPTPETPAVATTPEKVETKDKAPTEVRTEVKEKEKEKPKEMERPKDKGKEPGKDMGRGFGRFFPPKKN